MRQQYGSWIKGSVPIATILPDIIKNCPPGLLAADRVEIQITRMTDAYYEADGERKKHDDYTAWKVIADV